MESIHLIGLILLRAILFVLNWWINENRGRVHGQRHGRSERYNTCIVWSVPPFPDWCTQQDGPKRRLKKYKIKLHGLRALLWLSEKAKISPPSHRTLVAVISVGGSSWTISTAGRGYFIPLLLDADRWDAWIEKKTHSVKSVGVFHGEVGTSRRSKEGTWSHWTIHNSSSSENCCLGTQTSGSHAKGERHLQVRSKMKGLAHSIRNRNFLSYSYRHTTISLKSNWHPPKSIRCEIDRIAEITSGRYVGWSSQSSTMWDGFLPETLTIDWFIVIYSPAFSLITLPVIHQEKRFSARRHSHIWSILSTKQNDFKSENLRNQLSLTVEDCRFG